jgi:hypothetical protein
LAPLTTSAPKLQRENQIMSKGQDQKREQKKKPAKTLDEKRAAKKAKKANRPSGLMP